MNNPKPLRYSLFLLAVMLPWGSSVEALPEDKDQPILIKAQNVHYDQRTDHLIYIGRIRLTQGSIVITADRLEARAKNGKTEFVSVRGSPVHMRYLPDEDGEEVRLMAEYVEYQNSQREVILQGSVRFEQGKDWLTADYLRYHLDDERITSQRTDGTNTGVETLFYPKPNKQKEGLKP
jgi:lipopolysaccharide export system protein LptA